MPDACMVEVWAKDFVSKVDKGMTPVDDYWVSFEEDSLVMSKIFVSEDGKKQTVSVWVGESATGCKSRCEVILRIRDNSGECPDREFGVCPSDPNPWCGYAVMTCSADKLEDVVATIIDVRDNQNAPLGDDWADPSSGTATTLISPAAWRVSSLGMVFGMTSKLETGEIFFAASDIYAFDYKGIIDQGLSSVGFPPPTATGSGGPAGVYKTAFSTDPNAITIQPIIVTNATQYLEAVDAIGGSMISNFGNFDGVVAEPAGATNHFENFDSMGVSVGNGLGNITYDRRSNHLFVSNLEDGKIYSINCSTNRITDVFDPFGAYNHAVDGPGMVSRAERVWGVEVRQCEATTELYFARNTTQAASDNVTIRNKNIYKVDISFTGKFIQADGAESLVVTINRGSQEKITDISFDKDCTRMLIAERGYPHKARVFEYSYSGGSWSFSKNYFVGIYDPNDAAQPEGKIVGSSSGGGVAWGPSSDNTFVDATCDDLVWSTVQCGDAEDVGGRCDIYGLEGISVMGNDTLTSKATDIFVGLSSDPGENAFRLKNNLGDVELFSCCCPDNPVNLLNATVSGFIAGRVTTPLGTFLSDVSVSVTVEGLSKSINTDDDGNYMFDNLKMYQDYMIQPTTSGPVQDGISTLDLVKIQRHILGMERFNDPYQYIAADVNNSHSVSALDMVELRKLVLGKKNDMIVQGGWKTILESSLTHDNIGLEYLQIDDLIENVVDGNFVAVKIGDVSYDNSIYALAQSRSAGNLNLEMIKTSNGVEFKLLNDFNISGFQLSLNASVPNLAIESDLIEITGLNTNIQEELITISWNSNSSQILKKGDALFVLNGVELNSSEISISDELIAEAYNVTLESFNINIEEKSIENHGHISVSPNPFNNITHVSFTSASEDMAEVKIYNSFGQVVSLFTREISEGVNKFEVDFNKLNTSPQEGIYIIQIVTNSMISSKRVLYFN